MKKNSKLLKNLNENDEINDENNLKIKEGKNIKIINNEMISKRNLRKKSFNKQNFCGKAKKKKTLT